MGKAVSHPALHSRPVGDVLDYQINQLIGMMSHLGGEGIDLSNLRPAGIVQEADGLLRREVVDMGDLLCALRVPWRVVVVDIAEADKPLELRVRKPRPPGAIIERDALHDEEGLA